MPPTPIEPENRLDIDLKPATQLLMSVTTPSLLLGVLAQRQCGQWLEALGQFSESLFQGRRLPTLPFPEVELSETDERV